MQTTLLGVPVQLQPSGGNGVIASVYLVDGSPMYTVAMSDGGLINVESFRLSIDYKAMPKPFSQLTREDFIEMARLKGWG
jgi:hypothetical protein